MEMLIVLFLMFYSQKEPAFRQKVEEFLAFYRENRELIALALNMKNTQTDANTADTGGSSTQKEEKSQEKNRHDERADNLSVLENFLKVNLH